MFVNVEARASGTDLLAAVCTVVGSGQIKGWTLEEKGVRHGPTGTLFVFGNPDGASMPFDIWPPEGKQQTIEEARVVGDEFVGLLAAHLRGHLRSLTKSW